MIYSQYDSVQILLANLKKIASYLAMVSSSISLIIMFLWADGADTNKFLGGLGPQPGHVNLCTWHAILMMFAMGFCLIQAIVSYKVLPFPHLVNKCFHVFWHTAVIVLAVAGIGSIFQFHREIKYSHLSSLHSWLGLFTIILFGQNYTLGFVSYFFPGLALHIKKAYMPFHKLFGLMTLLAATVTMETGIVQKNHSHGCDYPVTAVDTNPASHYSLIPNGCKLSLGLGILLLLNLVLVAFSVYEFPKNTSSQSSNNLSTNAMLAKVVVIKERE